MAVRRVLLFCLTIFAVLSGCSKDAQRPSPTFFADENPTALSAWGMLSVDGALRLGDGVTPYDLNSPLFTDYAHKLRTIWMPGGKAAQYRTGDVLDFPVGTVITKTFYYPLEGARADYDGRVVKAAYEKNQVGAVLSDLSGVRLVETRLLVRREGGWEPVSYVWNDAQTDAALVRIGDTQQMTLVEHESDVETPFTYVVPNINQCAGCHAPNNTTREISPIGPKARHLNKAFSYEGGETVNQLTHLQTIGYLTGLEDVSAAPRNADWLDSDASVADRARAYLDVNCSHCHNAVGAADTSGLYLEPHDPLGPVTGVCKLPIAAGGGTGGRRFDIVPGAPEASIFVYRLESVQPDEMMPELGRSLSHTEGVALVRQWIAEMEGECA